MMVRRCIRLVATGILAACFPFGGCPTAEGADLDTQLHQLAEEIAGKATKGRVHRLAVEPFADLEDRVTQIGRLLASELTAELAAARSVQVIDPQQLAAHMKKRPAMLLSNLSRQELAKAGRELGLDGVIAGSVAESANQIRLVVKLIAVKDGHLVAAAKATFPKSGLLAELTEPAAKPPAPLRKSDSPPVQREESRPPEDMVLIPAGPFLYGEGDGQKTVTLSAFWVDLFEVTNSRYAEFRVVDYDPLASHHPVANVSWNQARQFCRSKGRRLPTEQEWKKAARGEDGRLYPWGSTYDPSLVNAESRHHGPTDVGKFEEGHSPYGLYDMAGNVMEWTDSGDDQVKVFRGGSWASSPQDTRTTSRSSIAPAHRLPDLGFRCAMDGPG